MSILSDTIREILEEKSEDRQLDYFAIINETGFGEKGVCLTSFMHSIRDKRSFTDAIIRASLNDPHFGSLILDAANSIKKFDPDNN